MSGKRLALAAAAAVALLTAGCGASAPPPTTTAPPSSATVKWEVPGQNPIGVVLMIPGGGFKRPSRLNFLERQAAE